jgi:hypothetical protein
VVNDAGGGRLVVSGSGQGVLQLSLTGGGWSTGPGMTANRYGTCSAIDDSGTIYSIAGFDYDANTVSPKVQLLKPGATSWVDDSFTLPAGRFNMACAALPGNNVLIFGGEPTITPSRTADRLVYWRNAGWVSRAPMTVARAGEGAALASDGKVYIVGGTGSTPTNDALASVERYDFNADQFAAAPALTTARAQLVAVSAPDGRVYAIGGHDASGKVLNSVEAFTPGATHWTGRVAALNVARMQGGGTLGSDGRIYVIGGFGDAVGMTAEAYGPVLRPSPASARAGDTITVLGANFAASANVTLLLANTPLATAHSDATGNVSFSLLVPVSAAMGANTLRAVDDRSQYPARAVLTVTP